MWGFTDWAHPDHSREKRWFPQMLFAYIPRARNIYMFRSGKRGAGSGSP